MSTVVRVSEAASLGLHTMAFLAAHPDGRFSAKQIAEIHHVSEAHLSKVLQRLAKVGLVNSVRGPKGGFRLGGPADEISLLDVYEAIDGPLRPTTCLFGTPICDGRACIMADVLKRVNEETNRYLTQTTVADAANAYLGEGADDSENREDR